MLVYVKIALTTAEKAYIVGKEYYFWPYGPKRPGWAKFIILLTSLRLQEHFHKTPPRNAVNIENIEDQIVIFYSGRAIQITQLLFV